MKVKQYKNIDDIRSENSLLLLRYYSKKSYFGQELSKESGLSIGCVKKRTDELLALRLIREVNVGLERKVGRNPVYYKINENYGVVVVVDLTNSKIDFRSFDGQVLESMDYAFGKDSDGHNYKEADFERLTKSIRERLVSPDYADKKLLAISVATFGRIDSEGEYYFVSDVIRLEEKNIKKYFESFGVPVYFKNDVDLSLTAEMRFGLLSSGAEKALYLKIAEGAACACVFSGKPLVSEKSTAGEIGYNKIYNPLTQKMENLSDCVSLFGISNTLKKVFGIDVAPEKIIENYLNKSNEHLNEVVEMSGKLLANTVRNLNNIFDFDKIVLGGEICRLGKNYLDVINREMNNTEILKQKCVEISFLQNEVSLGAFQVAFDNISEAIIEKDND